MGAFRAEWRWPGVLWYLAGAAFATSGLGVLAGVKFILPALDVAAAAPVLAWARRQRRFQGTTFALLFWAFWKTAATAFFTVLMPARATAAVAFGERYTDKMLVWLGTGTPDAGLGWMLVLKSALAVVGASLVTGGLGGLVVASLWLNCQAYFFGLLFLRTVAAWRVLAFGWPLWYIFLALGLANLWNVAAEPLAGRLTRAPAVARDMRDGLFVGLIMLAAAALAQSYLAPLWQEQLAPALIFDTESVLGI